MVRIYYKEPTWIDSIEMSEKQAYERIKHNDWFYITNVL